MQLRIGHAGAGIGAVLLVGLGWLGYRLTRPESLRLLTLFDADKRVENFRSIERVFPIRTIEASGQPFLFRREPRPLNDTYTYQGSTWRIDEFLRHSNTTGFLVIKNDVIVAEQYFLGNTDTALNIGWSLTKSVVSALIGMAIDDGLIRSVDEPVTDYLPELKGSGYDGVPIEDVLQMSSGVRFDEGYNNWLSDINLLFAKAFIFRKSINRAVAGLKRQGPPGQVMHYASINTQVLGMLVTRVTRQPLASVLEERLWRPLGMESHATWATDKHGAELAFCGLNATLRDYARFGRLYLNGGAWEGRQIVSEKWVWESTHSDKPYLRPGADSESSFGYGYQWWVPDGADDEFMSLGFWGQFIYIAPKDGLIVVKTSADPDFPSHQPEAVQMFRSIAAHLRD